MSSTPARLLGCLLRYGLVLLPWAGSLYLHYWLLDVGIWTPRTPFRGVMSVALLAIGMGLCFAIHTWLFRGTHGDSHRNKF